MRSFSGAAALLVLGVAEVVPDGPAAAAGIRVNDELLSVDGRPLDDFESLARLLDGESVGDRVVFAVQRGNDALDIAVTLAAWPG